MTKTLRQLLRKYKMLTREDVERITENVLRELTLEVKNGDFTNPNERVVSLKYRGNVISSTSFSVVEKDEYGDW